MRSNGEPLDVTFPSGEWDIAGLVVKAAKRGSPAESWKPAIELPRPTFRHIPPAIAHPGEPLRIALEIGDRRDCTVIRLHYRPVNQLAKFKTLEATPAKVAFTIPGEDVSGKWNVMYYFEILNRGGSGWFFPDPHVATPYYVVRTSTPIFPQ